MFVRATCFSYIDFLDIDGLALINLEVGNKTCSVLKQRGCATRELYGNRRVDSRKRDKEQMCPFGTGTELCSRWEVENLPKQPPQRIAFPQIGANVLSAKSGLTELSQNCKNEKSPSEGPLFNLG